MYRPIASHRHMDERQGQAAGTVFLFRSAAGSTGILIAGVSRNVVVIIVVQEEEQETTRNGNLIHDEHP